MTTKTSKATKPATTAKTSAKKPRKAKRAKRHHNRTAWLIAGGIILLLAVILAIYAGRNLVKSYNGERTTVYVPHDTDMDALRDTLYTRLDSVVAPAVLRLIGMSGSPKAGAYVVEDGTSAWRIARNITHGYQTPVKVTFNNIIDMSQLSQRISDRMEFTSADFEAAVDSLLIGDGYDRETVATAFTPDTYEFYWTDGADKVVKRLHKHTIDAWSGDRLAKADRLGLTPTEVSILASIVEEESSQRDEYSKIARLYLNRLDRGMKLQADPTVKRAVGDRTIRRVTGAHLKVDSPYNTYIYKGLPPGPLRIPALSTIDAVLDAPQHNYLYMCASPDFSGHHIFAADYETHKANARKYQAALDARGIR